MITEKVKKVKGRASEKFLHENFHADYSSWVQDTKELTDLSTCAIF
jgi:hypothetical protein